MLVFVDQVTERLQYTFDFVFRQHGIACDFTNDRSFFETASGTKLNYSFYPFENTAQLEPSGLLFDEHIDKKLKIEKADWNGTECLSIDRKTDPFAAIFYVLSRYEEYVVQQRDRHDRFEAKNSILFRFGWLQQQIVERWVEAICRTYLPEQLETLASGRKVTVIPSFDIDNTFAYKWKGGWRKWLATLRDLVKKNSGRLQERKRVNAGTQKDPYDTFAMIEDIAKRFSNTRVFWLLGDYGEYDRNISWHDPRHQRLIRTIAQVARVGLHPSYASNVSDKRLSEEKQRLAQITGKTVSESRQHFLKLALPQTYNRLIAEGFTKDYTLGYADQPGFRAGTAHPFFFFDLDRNEATTYKLIPFAYMDGTLNEYLGLSIAESNAVVKTLADEVKAYGGVFCFIWHNETIGNYGKWNHWSEVLEFTLQQFSDGSTDTVS